MYKIENRFESDEYAELAEIKRNANSPSSNKDNVFIIPVSWAVYSTVAVEADNLQQALQKAESLLDVIPLPDKDGYEYIDGSYSIDVNSVEDAVNAQEYRHIGGIFIDADDEIL